MCTIVRLANVMLSIEIVHTPRSTCKSTGLLERDTLDFSRKHTISEVVFASRLPVATTPRLQQNISDYIYSADQVLSAWMSSVAVAVDSCGHPHGVAVQTGLFPLVCARPNTGCCRRWLTGTHGVCIAGQAADCRDDLDRAIGGPPHWGILVGPTADRRAMLFGTRCESGLSKAKFGRFNQG
jgi:hypothetical protein